MNSTKQWIQSLSKTLGTSGSGAEVYFSTLAPSEGVSFSAAAKYENAPTKDDYVRLYCHWVIEHLPSNGLSELTDVLEDLAAFYSEAPDRSLRNLTSHTKVVANLGEQRVSAPLVISD